MHQRLSNSSAKPASGPEYSVPATGCAGTNCTPFGRWGCTWATTDALTEPTSETMAPGLSAAGDRLGDRAAGADRNAQDDAIGVARGVRRVGVVAVAEPEFLGAAERRRRAAVDRDVPGRGRRAARPARSRRRSARCRSGQGGRRPARSSRRFLRREEGAERGDGRLVRLVRTDGHAQRIRQARRPPSAAARRRA